MVRKRRSVRPITKYSTAMNGNLTKIEDIVPIVKFLATDGWWITGQTIFANGGVYNALSQPG